jgi:hypothetical protein
VVEKVDLKGIIIESEENEENMKGKQKNIQKIPVKLNPNAKYIQPNLLYVTGLPTEICHQEVLMTF